MNNPFTIVFERDNFTCQKCNFRTESNDELKIHHILPKFEGGTDKTENLITLCTICHKHAPDEEEEFKKYIQEKIDGNILSTFRKSDYSISKRTKKGMTTIFNRGKHLSKPPKGYKIADKMMVPAENSDEISNIFQEFIDSDISLTQLAKKHSMTPTGMKKLLRNITYLGKIKFDHAITEGTHKPILEAILFNQVQAKINELGWS